MFLENPQRSVIAGFLFSGDTDMLGRKGLVRTGQTIEHDGVPCDFCVPNRKTKTGKALAEKMGNISTKPVNVSYRLTRAFDVYSEVMKPAMNRGMSSIVCSGAYHVESCPFWVFRVPVLLGNLDMRDRVIKPSEELTPIKYSEFIALTEEWGKDV